MSNSILQLYLCHSAAVFCCFTKILQLEPWLKFKVCSRELGRRRQTFQSGTRVDGDLFMSSFCMSSISLSRNLIIIQDIDFKSNIFLSRTAGK